MIFAELLMGLVSLLAMGVMVGMAGLEVIFSVLFLVVELIAGIVNNRAALRSTSQPASESLLVTIARNKWFRRFGLLVCGCLILTIVTAVVLNLFFFENTARWLLARAEAKSGIHVTFASADGNLFTGQIQLRNATLKRDQHPAATFDLRADTFNIDLRLSSMIFGPQTVQSARVEGVSGQVTRMGKLQSTSWFSDKKLLIEQLAVRDATVTWTDQTRPRMTPLKLRVDELTSQNIRSRWVALDLLFKTNGAGAINDSAFTVTRKPVGDGQETAWHFRKLPVAAAAPYVGGPFTLLDDGHIEINAVTVWGGPDSNSLDMKWSLVFREVHATMPDGQGWQTTLAAPAVEFINRHSQELPLSFSLQFDQNRFDGTASVEATGLLEALADGATQAVVDRMKAVPGQVEGLRDRAAQRIRSLLPSSRPSSQNTDNQP